jgi:hypothetical protein
MVNVERLQAFGVQASPAMAKSNILLRQDLPGFKNLEGLNTVGTE